MNTTLACMRSAAAVAALLALAGPAGAAEAGKLLFVAGTVTLERAPPVALKAGDVVSTGDVVVTGEKSRAQLLMNDGARVALRAGSRYRIDEFALPAAVGAAVQAGTTEADGVAVSTLLKGGFRTATAAIGKDGKGNYEVRTPIGTLGIRGTDYTAVWCQGDCADAPGTAGGSPPRDGLYLATHTGEIVFRYGDTVLVVPAGEVRFIATASSPAESLPRSPEWLLQDGAGPLVTGAGDRPQGQVALPDLSKRDPPPGAAADGSAAPDPDDPSGQSPAQRPIRGTIDGQSIDLTTGQFDQRSPNNPPPPGTPALPPPSSDTLPPTTHVPGAGNNPPPPPPPSSAPPGGG